MKRLLASSFILVAAVSGAPAAASTGRGGPPATVTPIVDANGFAGGYDYTVFPPGRGLSGPGLISSTDMNGVSSSTAATSIGYRPAAAVVAQSSTSGNGTPGYFGAGSGLVYPVEIDAADNATASQIAALIASGPIGTVAANYVTAASGNAQASVGFATGSFIGVEGQFNAGGGAGSSYYLTCGNGFATCSSGMFTAPIFFAAASSLARTGSPLEFLSGIAIQAEADTGYNCAADGIIFSVGGCANPQRGSGNAIAYVDPLITLSLPGIDAGKYTLTVGNGDVANALGNGPGAIPEPASWAMLLAGFGAIGGVMRRRGTAVTVAA